MCGELKIGTRVLKQPTICAAVRAPDAVKMRKLAEHAVASGADLIELRIDSLKVFDGWKKCLNLGVPVILTNRPEREGGGFRGSEERRIEFLLDGIAHGVDCIDLEFSTSSRLFERVLKAARDTSIICSFHNFTRTPSPDFLIRLAKRMEKKPCDSIKIVTMAKSVNDNVRMLDFIVSSKGILKRPLIAFAMGKMGVATRFIGAILGTPIIYAAAEEKTAPGQLTVKETRKILNKIPSWEVED